jgi:hypothetical protein
MRPTVAVYDKTGAETAGLKLPHVLTNHKVCKTKASTKTLRRPPAEGRQSQKNNLSATLLMLGK